MTKTCTIELHGGVIHENDTPKTGATGFRVIKVTDSLDYAVGQVISRKDAQALCDNKNWKVTFK